MWSANSVDHAERERHVASIEGSREWYEFLYAEEKGLPRSDTRATRTTPAKRIPTT